MSFRTSISYTTLCLALSATSASADITGPEVWADWKSYMQGFGYDMGGSESQSGNTLTVNDISMNFNLPDNEGAFAMSMGSLRFEDNANGTVSVILPNVMPISFDVRPKTGEAAKGTLNYVQDTPTLIVSGEANDITYTYSAASIGLNMGGLAVDGVDLPPDLFKVDFTLSDVSNVTRMKVGNVRNYDQTMTAAALNYEIRFNIPEGPDAGKGSFVGSVNDLNFSGGGDIPLNGDMEDMQGMLAAGFGVDGGFEYSGGGRTMIDIQSPEGTVFSETSSSSGKVLVKMGPDGLAYDVAQTDTKINMRIPNIPLPISAEMAQAGMNIMFPIAPSNAEQDFAFGFTMGDFTISDVIWGIFDPAGQLPRDPATLSLDLTGKVKMLVDLFDPKQAAALEAGAAPGELNALSINKILLSAVGANVTGSGAFQFDNSDTTTFDGMPKPQGALDVRVEGVNALMDTLVSMGLLPEDQAMGARMMMGLFGVPQGEDVLTSKIEVNEAGHVLANGQRLR